MTIDPIHVQFNEICLSFDLRKDHVSQSAQNMAYWKRDKPIFLNKIASLKKQIQLELFNADESGEDEEGKS